MTDYLTLVIDDRIVSFIIYFFLFLMVIFVIHLFTDLISKAIDESQKAKRKIICKPYREIYEKFIENEEYRKALDYGHKYGEYVFDESVKGYFE
ncbi:MAG: hypothetical protein AABY22_33585 [Nanoarchaeota archaeon]